MGQIVGAAIVSHHPGLMQCEEFRVMQGNGADSDLIAGYERVRKQIDAVQPDVLLIFDTHWFTTGYHLVDGGKHYAGKYISDEMPWYLYGVPYDYDGCPELARAIERVARERKVQSRGVFDPDLPRHYPTINLVAKLARADGHELWRRMLWCAPYGCQAGSVLGKVQAGCPGQRPVCHPDGPRVLPRRR